MARGTVVSIILLVGVVALAFQTWSKTLTRLDQGISEFSVPSGAFKSTIVIANGVNPAQDADVLATVPDEMRTSIL